MEALTARSAPAPAPAFTPGLLEQYLSFIDRGKKTTQTYITNLRQFAAWIRYANVTSPTRQDIILYREYLSTEHAAIKLDADSGNGWSFRTDASGNKIIIACKPNTVKQYLQSVCHFFKWAASEGLYPNIADNIHAPKVSQDNHRKEALTAADVLAIERTIATTAAENTAKASTYKKDTAGRIERATEQGRRINAIYLLAVNCGLRTIEISRANLKDIETKNGVSYLYVWGKGHSEADTKKTLAPEVKAAIDEYLKCRSGARNKNSPLFTGTGNRSRGQRLAPSTISTMLKRAMQQAGYDSERITAHSLRHTAGTNVQELTGNLYLTQHYMRHANPATTEIYLHNDTERAEAEIAQRLYDHYHGKAGPQEARAKLERATANLSPEQLEQLANIARSMAK